MMKQSKVTSSTLTASHRKLLFFISMLFPFKVSVGAEPDKQLPGGGEDDDGRKKVERGRFRSSVRERKFRL